MKLSDVIIIPKRSKYQLDLIRYGLTHDKLMIKYKEEGLDFNKIFASHKRQEAALNRLKTIFPEEQFVTRDKLTKKIANKAKLIISFGGDNHFQYVSQFAGDNLITGINSDPVTSDGALTNFVVDDIDSLVDQLKNDEFKTEEWTRLELNINNKKIKELASSEIFIGESRRNNISRHIIELNGKKEEQKGSGLLIVTGSGSTGWYNSACRFIFKDGYVFPRTAKFFKFLLTEPHFGRILKYSMVNGIVKDDEELIVGSLNDSNGIISIDSLKEYKFKEGSIVKIRIGKTLKVVKK